MRLRLNFIRFASSHIVRDNNNNDNELDVEKMWETRVERRPLCRYAVCVPNVIYLGLEK